MADDVGPTLEPFHEETGLTAAWLRQKADPGGAAARSKKWSEENAAAIEAYNKRIEREGCFGEAWRTW